MIKHVAILCDSNPLTSPRPSRMIQMLRESYSLFVFGYPCPKLQGVQFFDFPPRKSAKNRTPQEQKTLENSLLNQDFLPLVFTPNRLVLLQKLQSLQDLSLIIVEDIVLLPLALCYKEKFPQTKIIIDLREFYPLEYENDSHWLQTFGKFFDFLCQTYLSQVDLALTVSEGLKQRYQEAYHLTCELFLSLPPKFDLTPSDNHQIQLIYHGLISQDRESENLLEIGSGLDSHLRLNIIALSNQPQFLESFSLKAKKIPSISLHAPVRIEEIIPFTHSFDLGLLTLKPNGFNNTYALPNKFFEYIQARLGVISTPLPEIRPLMDAYHFGLYSKDFETSSLITLLNSLSLQDVRALKAHAHQASQIFHLQHNQDKILSMIQKLLGD